MGESIGAARSLSRQERRYRRFKLKLPVHLLVHAEKQVSELDAVSLDVSIGGLLLDCPVPVPPHSPVDFIISFRSRSARAVELVGSGKVVRAETSRPNGNVAIAVECNTPITQIETCLGDDAIDV